MVVGEEGEGGTDWIPRFLAVNSMCNSDRE